VPAEPQALRLLARAARGSMRDALSLTDQAIAFGNGELQEAGVRQMLGSVDRSHVFRLIEALAQGDGKTVVETSEALRLHGLSAASTLEEMTAVLQRMAVLQAVPSRRSRRFRHRPRRGRHRAPGRADAGRRNAAALQPVPARPRRAGPGARRIRGADHGAAAAAGLQTLQRGCFDSLHGKKNSE
jgi:hypothetical protein